ncbi:MAG: hypothetical protein IKB98_01915 [Clostridia bacterium]|nr:hypothetical protein [Clostridia bacterium]
MNSEKTDYYTVDFSTLLGDIDLNSIFGADVTLTDAYHGRQELKLDGNKIVGGIDGTAFGDPEPIVITVYNETVGYNVQIKPYVYQNAEEFANDYKLSLYDGIFFDGDFKLTDIETIIGAGETIKEAYVKTANGQTKLPISADGKSVLGLALNGSNLQDFYLAIATDDNMVYIGVTGYTLILDEMSDFHYFFVPDGSWSYHRSSRWTIYSGMEWDGYYALANDIDATTYNHKGLENSYPYLGWDNVSILSASFGSTGATQTETYYEKYGLSGKGLTGIFDGRGHVIDQYKPNNGGLFQLVNGGIVRNLGFTNTKMVNTNGILAGMILHNATLENIFLQVDPKNDFDGKNYGYGLAGSINTSVILRNCLFYNNSSHVGAKGGSTLIAGESFGTAWSNVFFVSPIPIYAITSGAKFEAEYVNGVKTVAGPTVSNITPGTRRYTTFGEFINDVENVKDLTATFDPTIWTILNGGVPMFTSAIKSELLNFTVDSIDVSEQGNFVSNGQTVGIYASYNGLKVSLVDSLTLTSGDGVVEVVEGNKIKALTVGSAQLHATFNYKGVTLETDLLINVVPTLSDYAEEFYYSSAEGKFFTKAQDGTLVEASDALTTIFGKDTSYADLFAVYDSEGNALTIDKTNGGILGLTFKAADFVDASIDIYTEEQGFRVNLKVASLIIDEAEDLSYFTIKKPFGRGIESTYVWTFTDDDFRWDGYYVLANNIDASDYGVHYVENDMVMPGSNQTSLRAGTAASMDRLYSGNINTGGMSKGGYVRGLIGTFDGQGYTISNLTTTKSGLFGIVADATIKNVGFVNCAVEGNQGGFFSYMLGGFTTLTNVYVESNHDVAGSGYTPLATTLGVNVTTENVFIVDNAKLSSDIVTSAFVYGTMTTDATRADNQTYENAFNKPLANLIVISDKPVMATVLPGNAGNSQPNITFEAEFVDGAKADTTAKLAKEMRRYTSIDTLKADANYNFDAWDTNYWTITDGVPSFNSRKDVLVTYVTVNGVKVGETVEAIVGETIDVALEVNGTATPATSITADGVAATDGKVTLPATEGSVELKITNANGREFVVTVNVKNPVINANGQALVDNQVDLLLGESKTISLTLGANVYNDFTIETAETTDLITIAEKVITASSEDVGSMEIKLTVNGIEFFFTINVVSLDVLFNGTIITEQGGALEVDESALLTLQYLGEQLDAEIQLTTVGSGVVTVDGATITAVATGVETVNCVAGNMKFSFKVTVNEGATAHEQEFILSAHDGVIFNSDFTLADSEELFGDATAEILSAKDASGKRYQALDGKILGIESGKEVGAQELTLYSTVKAVKVNFTVYTLVLDEASDFDFLALSGSPIIENSAIKYDGTDFKKDGYYILANDIDASSYIFRGMPYLTVFNPTSVTAEMLATSGYGFSGVFDGQGHTVTDIAVTGWSGAGYGLFGFINGGTIKNVEFDGLYNTTAKSGTVVSNTGALAYSLVNGGKIQDVKITNKSTPGGSAASLLYYTSDATSSLSRVYIQDNQNTINVNSGAFWRYNSASFEDVYIVSKVPAYLAGRTGDKATIVSRTDESNKITGTDARFNYIIGDAEYVDGVLGANTRDYVTVGNGFQATYKCSEWIITDSNGKTYGDNAPDYNYSISILNGVKRYTSISNMKADAANNDFSNWDSNLWEIVNGVPTFINSIDISSYQAYAGNKEVSEAPENLIAGESVEFSIKLDGVAITGKPVVTVTAGNEYITVEGTVVKAVSASGANAVTVDVAYNGIVWTQSFVIYADITATDHATEYFFSAHDGQFYDEDFNVVSVDDIFGEDVTVVRATDKDGKKLQVVDQTIRGLDLGKASDWTSTKVTLYTDSTGLNISIKGADAIINEASDLAAISLKSPVSNDIVSPDGEGKFDGYYVMINDIDATDYLHTFAGETGFSPNGRTFATVKEDVKEGGIFYEQGFTGVFDGQGHVISNLSFDAQAPTAAVGGLFGIINGGTVKNVGFTNTYIHLGMGSGVLAKYIVGEANISDVYIEVSGSRNDGVSFIIADYVAESASLERMYITWLDSSPKIALWGSNILVNANNAAEFNVALKDSYFVSKAPAMVTTDANGRNASVTNSDGEIIFGGPDADRRLHRIAADALYVDGIKNETATSNEFRVAWYLEQIYTTEGNTVYTNGVTYEAGSTYAISVLDGLKRYSSLANMKADAANNDFSSWNSDIWEIVNGVPTFLSQVDKTEYAAYAGESQVSTNAVELTIDETVEFSIKLNGTAITGKPVVTVTAGDDYITMDGTTLKAIAASGESEVAVSISYRGIVWTQSFVIYPNIEVTDKEDEVYFSVHDGQFYNDNFDVVTIDELFGEDVTVVRAYDEQGNKLQVVDQKIMGLDLGAQTDWASTKITLYTAEKGIRVSVKAADLIIDETADFEYFGLNGTATIAADSFVYDGDDFVWDGYHVVVKDIDAKAYSHHTDLGGNNTGKELGNASMEAVADTNYGLSGVFDGQGHTIDRMFIDGTFHSGLFPIINGGTVKNVRFTNLFSGYYSNYRPSGVTNYYYTKGDGSTAGYQASKYIFSTYMVNGAKIEDVDINFHNNALAGGSMLYHGADETSSITNAVISVTKSATNIWGNYIMPSTKATLSNVYVIATMGLGVSSRNASGYITPIVEEGETAENTSLAWSPVNFDAAKVDGVTRDYVNYFMGGTGSNYFDTYSFDDYTATTAEGGTTYSKENPVSRNVTTGVIRYTSIANMQADKATNDFSSWDSSIWEIVNGVPTFLSQIDQSGYTAYVNNSLVSATPYELSVDETADFSVELDGKTIVGKPTVEITAGGDYITVEGTTVKAIADSGENAVTVTVKYRNKTWTQSFVVYANVEVTEGAQEYKFSAHDGQFYDDAYGIVTVDEIFGEDVTVVRAYDEQGNKLQVVDQKIMGLDLGKQSTWATTKITLYTATAGLKVTVKAADAIIDEAADLAVFTPQATGEISATSIVYNGDDLVDDGYYVMVKDVDAHAEGYFHNVSTVANFKLEDADMATVAASEYGFSGVFDGQGHKIDNLFVGSYSALGSTTQSASLFGWVNGGTIKNVSFNNLYAHNSSATSTLTKSVAHGTGSASAKYLLATYLVNGAKIQDVSIEFGRMNASAGKTLFKSADSTSAIERVYLRETHWNTYSTNGGGFFDSNSATFTDVYFVSKLPVQTNSHFGKTYQVETIGVEGSRATQKWFKVLTVAGSVDGVAQTGVMDYVLKAGSIDRYDFATYNVYTSDTATTPQGVYNATVLSGLKQYTTLENMQADAANNSFTGWDSTLWTITNGVPSMNVIG